MRLLTGGRINMIEHVNKAQACAEVMVKSLEPLIIEVFAFKESQAFDDLSPKGKQVVNKFAFRLIGLRHDVESGIAEVARMTNRFVANT